MLKKIVLMCAAVLVPTFSLASAGSKDFGQSKVTASGSKDFGQSTATPSGSKDFGQ